MHIMFVCTGNVCRSPMGELLMRRYLSVPPLLFRVLARMLWSVIPSILRVAV